MKFYFLIGELEGEVHIYTTYLSCEKDLMKRILVLGFKRGKVHIYLCVCVWWGGWEGHGSGRLHEMVVLDLDLESMVGITWENQLRKKGNSG